LHPSRAVFVLEDHQIMGQAASSSRRRGADPRASPAEVEQPVVIHNGVRLTAALANRLALQQAGGHALAAQLVPLETSRLVNDLLVAREEEELEKIDKLSREILEREAEKYGLDVEKEADSGEARMCGVEEGLVARCYREQAEDPLLCRGLVDSYVKCAFDAAK
jgi:hypothetical protein